MALNKRIPPFDEKSFAKAAGPYRVRFTGANPPTGLVQDEGEVSSITRTGAGVYRLNLRGRYMRIISNAPNIELTGPWMGKVLSKVEGVANANSVTIECNNLGVGIADPNAVIEISFNLISTCGS